MVKVDSVSFFMPPFLHCTPPRVFCHQRASVAVLGSGSARRSLFTACPAGHYLFLSSCSFIPPRVLLLVGTGGLSSQKLPKKTAGLVGSKGALVRHSRS